MVPRARAEAQAALDLLPSDPMAHAVLCAIAGLHDYDWQEAEEQFRLAYASGSLPPTARMYGAVFYCLALGRFDEAIVEMTKVIAEDPLNSMWRGRLAWILLACERYEDAIAQARKALELDTQDYQARMMIAIANTFNGSPGEAREHAEEVFRLAPFDSYGRGLLAGLLAKAGEKERADHLIATMTGAIPIGMLIYNLVCSNIDAAADWYQKDLELHRPNAPMIASSGYLKPLRSSPRWAKLASMMNLPAPAGGES